MAGLMVDRKVDKLVAMMVERKDVALATLVVLTVALLVDQTASLLVVRLVELLV